LRRSRLRHWLLRLPHKRLRLRQLLVLVLGHLLVLELVLVLVLMLVLRHLLLRQLLLLGVDGGSLARLLLRAAGVDGLQRGCVAAHTGNRQGVAVEPEGHGGCWHGGGEGSAEGREPREAAATAAKAVAVAEVRPEGRGGTAWRA
jgi:hypothetical protein